MSTMSNLRTWILGAAIVTALSVDVADAEPIRDPREVVALERHTRALEAHTRALEAHTRALRGAR